MKKILLDEGKKFFKGNMHCHSTKSDGKYTPEELKKVYKDKGYSFLAITDHEAVRDNSYLDDENFITITSAEYAIKEFAEQSTLKNLKMKVCHLNLYAKDQHNENSLLYCSTADHYSNEKDLKTNIEKFGDTKRVYGAECINNIVKEANDNGFFVSYNHPRWSLENYREYGKYEGLWGVEIYNSSVNVSGIYEYDINVFDDFLRDGKNIFAMCGDDNHNIDGLIDSFGAFVMVNCESLTYDNVINGLLNGNFYSSTGPEIYSLVLDGDIVKIKCSKAKKILLSTEGRYSKCKAAEEGEFLCEAEFEIKDDFGYFRLDVIDEFGKRANTQAYRV